MENEFDIIVIGAGVVGCAIARELSRFNSKIAVIEKDLDVASGASGRNSGVVHAGFNNPSGSLKAKYCVEGNALFEGICLELDVPYKKTGKLVVAQDETDLKGLENLKNIGAKNNVPDLHIVDKNEINKLEPEVAGIAALFSGSTAITNPFLLTVALAENAVRNGVRFFFDSEVKRISRAKGKFRISAGENSFSSDCVINSAGIYSDKIAAMAGVRGFKLYPCRGQYHILDKKTFAWLKRPVYTVPRPGSPSLGVHLSPTVEGNVLIGPSGEYVGRKFDHSTTKGVMEMLTAEARELWPIFSPRYIIRSYSGIRPKLTSPNQGGSGDFIIEEAQTIPGLINLIGIESPGLTSAIPIARRIVEIVNARFRPEKNREFVAERKGTVRFSETSPADRAALIGKNPDFGEIICRCEKVSRKEILEAANNVLGVRTLTGIKYRARCLTGRCQGGYCLTRIVDILTNELKVPIEKISTRGKRSTLFTGKTK